MEEKHPDNIGLPTRASTAMSLINYLINRNKRSDVPATISRRELEKSVGIPESEYYNFLNPLCELGFVTKRFREWGDDFGMYIDINEEDIESPNHVDISFRSISQLNTGTTSGEKCP